SFLLQAQSSKAKIIGLANAGADTTNSIKQAAEFGITQGGQKLAALLLFITDVNSLGLNTAQGLNFTETYYWDLNDASRAFGKRFQARMKNHSMPTMVHAGVYASLLHYFKALEALGGNPHDGAKVVAKMKEIPTDDPLFGKGEIEPNGRAIHPAYLFEVKKPSESKGPWDYYKLVATIPANEAFTPLDNSTCPLLQKQSSSWGSGGPPPQLRQPETEHKREKKQALYAQLLVGLINGSFYALLSLGLAVIFGMLNIINFAHGGLYMMGAVVSYFLLNLGGINYWWALLFAPIIVGIFGMILERTMLQWLAGLDHLYGLLLTFGLALIIQGIFQNYFGSPGLPYSTPDELKGGMTLGFMYLPIYRGWVVIFSLVGCLLTWYPIERTRLGATSCSATP